MLTQAQADSLIALLKRRVTEELFVWENNQRQDELIISVDDKKIQFVLTLKRNPFEIRLHFRLRDRDIGLIRLDNARYHSNPDGTELIDTPHLHWFREGDDLAWAEQAPWCDVTQPLKTLEYFLDLIKTKFESGYQLAVI